MTTSETSQGLQRSGAEEACWAHNPEVGGSKPPSATYKLFDPVSTQFSKAKSKFQWGLSGSRTRDLAHPKRESYH